MTPPDSEISVARLIKLAGGRDMPTAQGMERARAAAQVSWQRAVEQHAGVAGPRAGSNTSRSPRRNSLMVLALAAGLAAVALFGWHQRPAPVAPELLARIATVSGGATVRDAGGETLVRVELPIRAGSTLATSEGRVALTFGDSLSLRIDRQTRLRFDRRGQVTLLAGAMYVDSGGVNAVTALRIETPAGVVRHVGTQFQVEVTGDTTRVRVREGRVLITRALGTTDIAMGDELTVTGNQVAWRRNLPSFGPGWEWSAAIAPPLEIENRPLTEFLAWMTRENGWEIRYGDETLQRRAREIRLHGSLDQLGSDAMLERVSMVTGVPLSAREGVLWVGPGR